MKKHLPFIFFLIIMGSNYLFAQIPVISYSSPQTYTVGAAITLAPTASGVGAPGYSSTKLAIGTGFDTPEGIATDGAGNVYVADNGHHMIKEIFAGGGATITLGSGYEGPYSVAVDIAGNVYVADGGNGVTRIPAGGGSPVNIGSGFVSSKGVALDAAGNIFVADNGFIVKIPVGGGPIITLGTVSNALGLTVDAAGNAYVANGGGSISEIPASGGGAPVNIGSGFSIPNSVAVDAAGNLYVADYGHNTIKKVPAGGGSTVTMASGLTNPYGVAIDGKGNLYVSLSGSNTVKMITPVGGYFAWPFLPAGLSFASATGNISGTPAISSAATNYTVTGYNTTGSSSAIVNISVGTSPPTAISVSYATPQTYAIGIAIAPLSPVSSGVSAPGYSSNLPGLGSGFNGPEGVAVDASGNVYVADFSNGAVKKMPAGGGTPVTLGTFAQPNGVAVDLSGNVYVSNGGVGIMKIPAGGGSPVTIGTGITNPYGVAVDGAGNVYLSDLGDNSVKEIPVTGGAAIVLSSAGSLLSPYGVAVDAAGNVYVADLEDNAVKKIPNDGTGVVAIGGTFSVPFGVAIDGAGNVYVTDSGDKRIREIPAGGGATVTLSTGFVNPYGIAVDGKGNVYVADQVNNTVRQIKPVGGYYLNPFLPAGLNFNNTTGIISGTPSLKSPAANYTVTAYNNSASATAMVGIKVASNNAGLASMLLSTGALSPSFTATTTSYTASVSNATASVTVTPAVTDAGATVKVNGTPVISGSQSGAIPLIVGPNTISTVVTAEDGVTTKTYTLIITRAPSSNADLAAMHTSAGTLSPAFSAGTTAYTASVGNGITTITLTPTTADLNATIKVNGVMVKSGAASGLIQLTVGSNVITTTVTAQDSATTKKYILNVIRAASSNANLSGIKLINNTMDYAPVSFFTGTTSYIAFAPYGTASVMASAYTSDANATVKINGTAYSNSGNAVTVPLFTGPNPITFTVTAQDGITTKTYTITLAVGSSNPGLSALQPNTGTLSPAFDENAFNLGDSVYTVSVANATESITLTPTTVDATATVKINGTAVTSGTASAPIPLNVGMNTITLTVTAEDGVVINTYGIYVFRASATPQVPSISYSGPQVYSVNKAIATLTPVSSGVAAPGYSNTPTSMGNGLSGVVADGKGNVFLITDSGALKKVPAGGGIPVAIPSKVSGGAVPVDPAANLYYNYGTAIEELPDNGGPPITLFDATTDPRILGEILGIAVDPAGTVYFCSRNEVYSLSNGVDNPIASQLSAYPFTGIAIDSKGTIYVSDDNSIYLGLASPPNRISFSGYFDIGGLSVDVSGNLFEYYLDGDIKEVDTDFGQRYPITTIASGFVNPTGIAEDAAANVYVANGNNEVDIIKSIGGYHIAPALPNGLNFSRVTGVISGTPTVTSPPTNYVITACNSTGSSSATVNIAVAGDANLSNLKVSGASLSPSFTEATTSYSTTVANSIQVVNVTPTASDGAATVKVNGTAVTSGTASAAISLNVGPNTIATVVAAPDGFTTKTYTVTVTRAASSEAYLSTMSIKTAVLSPTFVYNAYSYTSSVANSVSSVTVTPSLIDVNGTITVNGTTVGNKQASGAIALAEGGQTIITVVVTAQDGVSTHTYTVTITRAPSSTATLSSLKLSTGTLTPVFATAITSYTTSVANSVSTITVTPTTTDANATITVNGTAVTSGTASGAIALAEGAQTVITTVVTAQDGTTTKTYTLTVARAPSSQANLANMTIQTATLSPAFAFNTYSYTSSVANSVSSVTVTPSLIDVNGTIKVNGTTVGNKQASGAIALAEGTQTVITVVTTAQDGVSTHTYTVTITRAPSSTATLSALKLSTGTLSPVFATATTSYTTSVANSVSTITVTPTTTDANATVKVNGTAVTSGTASGAIALAEGAQTVITTVVTAQDGTMTKTYTLTVTRAPSSQANLANMTIQTAALSPAFAFNTYSYTSSVANSVSSVTVTPSLIDVNGTIKANGTTVGNKQTSGAITLAVGQTAINVVVTAQDGVSTHTYTVTITRAASGADEYDPGISVTKPTETPQLADDGIQVHQGVSPNGDGINDFLQIDNISQYPDNKLSIMNRNGQLIYEASSYDNASKVFDGHSNKNGKMQLPGTYFYQLDYTVSGITKHKTGFIVLKY